ncbi:MAG: phosphate--acyl-ACP acyltransferase [Chloroflexota bacterium]|nr:phosphate--acyl-ACP acyltransferase [Chloroflexota bacterium]
MQGETIRIALDGMGGDFAPREVVRGAVKAAQQGEVLSAQAGEIILVGPEERLQAELAASEAASLPIQIYHTDQFIRDGESPAAGLRAKPQASVALCAQFTKEGQADAAVTMGHTGAAMIAAHWAFGPLPGVSRPVAGGDFLPLAPETVAFDLGANAGCKPEQFLQFAAVGVAYARCLLGITEPTVGLLSNGTEPGKGIPQTRAAYELLEKSEFNFVGYIEGWDLASGRVNVVLCDGFVGNILIKYSEGLGRALAGWLGKQLEGQLPAPQIEELTGGLREMMEIEKGLGGGPLLGVDGVMIVGHGRSRAPAVAKAIAQARRVVESGLIEELRAELAQVAQE